MSLGSQWYTSNELDPSSPTAPLALPSSEDAHPLYRDWEIFNRCLEPGDEHVGSGHISRETVDNMTTAARTRDAQTAAVLHRLRCEVEDALVFVENREKRSAAEKRTHLAPSDAMKQQVREMQPVPRPRTYTVDTENSIEFAPFGAHTNMSNSTTTIRPGPSTPSPRASPSSSPRIEQEFFGSGDWTHSPTSASLSIGPWRSSVSTTRSSISVSPDPNLSPATGLGIETAETTPEDAFSHTLHTVLSSASLATFALGEGALQWTSLCRKVQVERESIERLGGREKPVFESQECDMHWKYREDAGMSLRASYRSKKDGKARVWTIQDFPATGPSIPRTTTIDGDISLDFPRNSYGRLDKQWKDIRYTFTSSEASAVFQTLLYTDNGKDAADLLFDRPVRKISSDKNRPECRGRNLRLWRRSEMRLEMTGPIKYDVLVLLFFTSVLEEKGHWVEEPHYAFEWIPESTYARQSDELRLVYSKDPAKWTPDKLFQRRKSSQSSANGGAMPTSPGGTHRRDSMELPGITRTGTGESTASSVTSVKSSHSNWRGKRTPLRAGRLNAFGYARLDIEFQSVSDRSAFLEVWRKYAKPLGTPS